MKIQELRDSSNEELVSQLNDLRKELFSLKNELAMVHKLEKPHLLKIKKRNIAQVLTILSEKEGQRDGKKE